MNVKTRPPPAISLSHVVWSYRYMGASILSFVPPQPLRRERGHRRSPQVTPNHPQVAPSSPPGHLQVTPRSTPGRSQVTPIIFTFSNHWRHFGGLWCPTPHPPNLQAALRATSATPPILSAAFCAMSAALGAPHLPGFRQPWRPCHWHPWLRTKSTAQYNAPWSDETWGCLGAILGPLLAIVGPSWGHYALLEPF